VATTTSSLQSDVSCVMFASLTESTLEPGVSVHGRRTSHCHLILLTGTIRAFLPFHLILLTGTIRAFLKLVQLVPYLLLPVS
jgi:hypothetical protein